MNNHVNKKLIKFFSIINIILALMISNSTCVANDYQYLTFNNFLEEVSKQNLGLKVEATKSDISDANAIGARIPTPTISYSNRSYNSGTANGIEIEQKVPFPSKISNDYLARKYEAGAQKEFKLAVESEVFAKARLIYFNLWKSLKLKEILREKKVVVEKHIKLARAIARSDSFLKVHLVRAEADLEFLNNELIAANQNIKEKSAIMAEFLNTSPEAFQPALEEPPFLILPIMEELQNPHQLETKKLTIESIKKREKEANSEWLPDFYLRYGSMSKTQIMPGYSEATIGISMPFIFPWEPYSITQKTSASKRLAEAEYAKEKIKIEAELVTFFSKIKTLKNQLDNIEQKLMPLAKKRLSMIQNLTPRDLPTLQEYRETLENLPDLKLKELELRSEYENTISEILKYQRAIK